MDSAQERTGLHHKNTPGLPILYGCGEPGVVFVLLAFI
jgi:hypothetical protein